VGLVRHGKDKLGDEWQKFYRHWRDSSIGSKFLNTFPYILELGVVPEDESLLHFHPGGTSKNQIVVTESYDDMFRLL
jgi:hypothetical protein